MGGSSQAVVVSAKSLVEGFQEKELTDLLDKIRVNLYSQEQIWDNKFYNNQPDKKEKEISFWRPLNDTGEGYRVLGHCVSESYDAPSGNTMLVMGDTKPPVGSKLVFSFPDNIMTAQRLDSYGEPRTKSPLDGINTYEDLVKRINQLRKFVDTCLEQTEKIKTGITAKLNLAMDMDTYKIEVFGKDSLLDTPVKVYSIKPGGTVTVEDGTYNGIRIPAGSSVTLIATNGKTVKFDLDYSGIVDPANGQFKKPVSESDIYAKTEGITKHDFKVIGPYGLAWQQGTLRTYPDSNDQAISSGGLKRKVTWPYQSAMGTMNEGMSGGGKKGLMEYFVRQIADGEKSMVDKPNVAEDDKIYYSGDSRTNKDYYFGSRNGDKKSVHEAEIKRRDFHDSEAINFNNTIQSPHVYIKKTQLNTDPEQVDVSGLEELISEFASKNAAWFDSDSKLLANIGNMRTTLKGIEVNQYYTDLAFRLQTYWKKLRMVDGGFGISYAKCPDGNSCNCCYAKAGEIVDLHNIPAFKGAYLKSAIIKLNIQPDEQPFIRTITRIQGSLYEYMDKVINNISQNIAELEDVQRSIESNTFSHYPMRIFRPTAPANYVNLGDVMFNHKDTNYTAKEPLLETYACVPEQCVREVRDWLAIDKIYEYQMGDVYLAIFRNPYLQTFRAVTTPGMLPPGRLQKVVACVEKCRLLDDIIEADKCSKKFYKANKSIMESNNLDTDKIINNRTSALYSNKVQEREKQIKVLKEVARKLQLQDDKAELVNREYNRSKLQNLVDKQRANISAVSDRLSAQKGQIEVNIRFNYDKFSGLIYKLRESKVIPATVADKVVQAVDTAAKQNLDVLPETVVNEVLAACPTPNTEGLVLKSLVESGCYNCYFNDAEQ
jgi:predicted RNA binding protein with dsRBD fold (UPF0201 family)